MRIGDALRRARAVPVRPSATRSDEELRLLRERDLATRSVPPVRAVGAVLVTLVLATLLTSPRLVEMARRQPLGPARDRWIALAERVDGFSHTLGLDRPYRWLTTLRGAGRDVGERVDTLEELAAAVTTSTTLVPVPVPSATVPTPPPTSAPTRTVTAADPLRVFVAGDSQAEFLGQALVARADDHLYEVGLEHRISTGLARPDYFNWPAELVEVVRRDDPEAIVLFLGANDYQDMADDEGRRLVRGGPEWSAEWSRRLSLMLDLVSGPGRHVVWIGQPPMRDRTLDEGVRLLNDLAHEVIDARDEVTFVDIWDLFGGDGGFRERVTGPDGETARARNDDGVHLTRTAAGWVADLVTAVLDEHWGIGAG